MPEFSPETLATWTAGRWTAQPGGALTGFATDTRQLRAGQVFVALQTDKRDGHDFLPAALAAGASAAVVARPNSALKLPQLVVADPLAAFQAIAREHRRTFSGKVAGITGSAGKTSTKNLLAELLGGESVALPTAGNLNNHLGVPLTLTRIDPAQHRFAVIEAGISGPGEMKVLADMIEPDLVITTLIAPAHLEELGGIDGVAREKSVLPASVRAAGVAIFPKQCDEFPAFRDLAVRKMVVEPAEVIRPAEPPKDKVYFAVTQRGESTAIALAYGPPPPLVFTMRRVSNGMAQNAALAICAALWLGVSKEHVQARLSNWQPTGMRGEWRHESGRLLYLDCYNANPASMSDALETFYDIAPANEPRLLVLGGMEELGGAAAEFHRMLGRRLRLRPQDTALVIGDHAAAVRSGAIEAGARSEQVTVVTSTEPMRRAVADFRGAVFVKGSRRWQLENVLESSAATSTCAGVATAAI